MESDEIIIASPYLLVDFNQFFDTEVLSNLKSIRLITTLIPNTYDQLKKVKSLNSLVDISEIENCKIKCTISFNNLLHGKVYLFKKDSNFHTGIITSANFTYNGLQLKHEWGIKITDFKTLNDIETSLLSSIEPEFKNITHTSIRDLKKHVAKFKEKDDQDSEIDLDLTNFLQNENDQTDNENSSDGNKRYEYKITQYYLETWHDYFNEFVEFKKEKNEVTVPRDYKNPSLYLWYRKQKIFNANNSIPLDHKEKLEEIGFYFGDGHEIRWARIWEENYAFLKAYYDEYGNSDVPHTHEKSDPFYTLGNWVALQKTYRNNDVLSDYKIEKLDDLDFIWMKGIGAKPLNEKWLLHFNEIKVWKELYDDCHVPQLNEDGSQNKLGRWLNEQRRLKNTGRKKKNGEIVYLDSERENMLLELGVDFDHETNKHKDSFEKQVQAFLSYRFQYPDLKPPSGTFKTERDNLAQWRHKFKKLPEWKKKRLIETKII
jgi:hypothetical protein